MVLAHVRVQSRLSSIDARAKLVPEFATRNQRNEPSLHNVQQPQYGPLVDCHAVCIVRMRAHHASLGLRLRMSRDVTAPSRRSFSSVMGSARKL